MIPFLIFSNCLLLVYFKIFEFCLLNLCIMKLLNSLVDSFGFATQSYHVHIMSFISSSIILIHFISFPYLVALARISNKMELNQ